MKNNNLLGVNNDFKIDFIENFIRLSKVNTYINEAGKNVQIIDYSFEPVNVTKKRSWNWFLFYFSFRKYWWILP